MENIPLVKFIKTTSRTQAVYYRWRNFGNFPSKFVGVLRLLNFTYTFFKALLIFCHCRALFSSVLFLKIIVNNVFYCYTVNLSRHNYFLANKNLLFYRCLFVYIIKRTLHGGLKIWILFSRGKSNILLAALVRKILFCHSKLKFISSRHRVISSLYTLQTGARLQNIKRFAIYCHVEHLVHFVLRYFFAT